MKKFFAAAAALLLAFSFTACSRNTNDNTENNTHGKNREVAVFYYTYSDTYISSVRAHLDEELRDEGIKFQNYDANGNQTTQTEQVQTAIAKGVGALAVNIVDTGSDDAALHITELAKSKNIPVIFFNRSVSEYVINSYDKCIMIGTDYEMAGHMQGEMIGNYLVENYDSVDLNGDGKISYVMFKGQEGNLEAIARTQYSVADADRILRENNRPELLFYDEGNTNRYLVDQDGTWSSSAATNYMGTILARYSEDKNNMVELVIANNDEMALGAVAALQSAGYNNGSGKTIPVFGVDATDAAKTKIAEGVMTGTIKQDAEGMAEKIAAVSENFLENKNPLEGTDKNMIINNNIINMPYEAYTKD